MPVVTFTATCVDLTVEPVVITTAATISVVEGAPLSIALTATGGVGDIHWNIEAIDPSIYDLNGETDTISWVDDGAQTPGDYVLTAIARDSQGNEDELVITTTVTAAVGTLPGDIATFTATPINDTTVKLEYGTSSNALTYWYSAAGSPEEEIPTDKRLRLFSALTPYTVTIWGRNAVGDGNTISDTFTTLSSSQATDDFLIGTAFDETDQSTYTKAFTVTAGSSSNFLLIGVVTQSATAHRVYTVTFNDISGIEVESTSDTAALLQVGWYRIPWGSSRTGGTYNVVVTTRDSTLASAVSCIRCDIIMKRVVKRSSTPIATYTDTAGAVSLSVPLTSNQIVFALTAAISADSSTNLVPDLNGLTLDEDTEDFQGTLNFVSGYHSSADGETRTIGADWVDPSAATSASLARMVAVVYDEPIEPVSVGIVPLAADSLVEKWAIDTHADWDRAESNHGDSWHWGSDTNPTLDNLIQYMGELGVRYYRMGPAQNNSRTSSNVTSQNYKYAREWYDTYGMQAFGPIGDEAMTLTKSEYEQVITSTESTLNFDGKRRFYAYEGPNESNHGRAAGWNTRLIQVMNWILDHRAANYPNAKVIGPSIWGRNTADIETLIATSGWSAVMDRVDFGTLHTYNGARKPTVSGKPLFNGSGDDTGGKADIPYRQTLLEHNALYNNKELCITETGFKRGNPQGFKGWTMPTSWVLAYGAGEVSVRTYMKYILRYFMASLEINEEFGPLGIFSPYVFFDDVETQPNFCFGICYPNQAKTSLIKLPSYATIQRFLNLFKDKTFSYAAGAWQYSGSGPTLTALNYTITGTNEFTRPIRWGQSQRGILYRKQDGKYLIPLYQDEISWDRSANADYRSNNLGGKGGAVTDFHVVDADINPARRLVTFDAGQVVSSIKWYEPTFDNTGTYPADGAYSTAHTTASARKTANNTQTMTIEVPDHVGVIEVTL